MNPKSHCSFQSLNVLHLCFTFGTIVQVLLLQLFPIVIGGETLTINNVCYELDKAVGSGHNGKVLKANVTKVGHSARTPLRVGDSVAIKVINYEGKINRENYREDCLQEMVVAERFIELVAQGKPLPKHVIRMHDQFLDEPKHRLYVVMERGGWDLSQVWRGVSGLRDLYRLLLGTGTANGLRRAVAIVEGILAQIARGLDELHNELGFLHLNLKARNMLFVPGAPFADGEAERMPKILENLGPLKLIDLQTAAKIGPDGQVIRNFNHGRSRVAPEYVYRCPDPSNPDGVYKLTPKADIWSLGVFLWEFLEFERDDDGGLEREAPHSLPTTRPLALICAVTGRCPPKSYRLVELKLREITKKTMLRLGSLRAAADIQKRVRSASELTKLFVGPAGNRASEDRRKQVLKAFNRIIVILKACFQLEPAKRPTAADILKYLEDERKGMAVKIASTGNALDKPGKRSALEALERQWFSLLDRARPVLENDGTTPHETVDDLKLAFNELYREYGQFLGQTAGVCD